MNFIDPLNVREQKVQSDATEIDIISMVVVKAVVNAARERGVRLVLPEVDGVDLSTIEDPACGLSRRAYASLLERIADQTGDDTLGLTLGSSLTEVHFHITGPLIMSCLTARQAIDCFLVLRRSVLGGPAWQLSVVDGECRLGHPLSNLSRAARIEAQLGVALAYGIGARFWGAWSLPVLRAEFAFAPPARREPYEAVFGDAVSFGQERSCLVFPERLLDYARPEADPALAAALAEFAHERYLRSRSEPSWTLKVQQYLLSADADDPGGLCSLASAWQLSPRTLRRRLELEQTSYKALRERVQLERGARLLEEPNLSIEQVAAELGYREANSFRRAFKKWSGHSPSRYRSLHRQ